jgi:hypothetical protein
LQDASQDWAGPSRPDWCNDFVPISSRWADVFEAWNERELENIFDLSVPDRMGFKDPARGSNHGMAFVPWKAGWEMSDWTSNRFAEVATIGPALTAEQCHLKATDEIRGRS